MMPWGNPRHNPHDASRHSRGFSDVMPHGTIFCSCLAPKCEQRYPSSIFGVSLMWSLIVAFRPAPPSRYTIYRGPGLVLLRPEIVCLDNFGALWRTHAPLTPTHLSTGRHVTWPPLTAHAQLVVYLPCSHATQCIPGYASDRAEIFLPTNPIQHFIPAYFTTLLCQLHYIWLETVLLWRAEPKAKANSR